MATPTSRESGPPDSSTTNSEEEVLFAEDEGELDVERELDVLIPLDREVDAELEVVEIDEEVEEVVAAGPLVPR